MQMFNHAVQAIQNGQHEEGARLLRLFIRDETNPTVRAVAWLWLAETDAQPAFKIDCYQRALADDPQNADAQARLNFYLSQQLPTPPTPTPPPQQAVVPSAPPQGVPAYTNPNTPPQGMPPAHDTGAFAPVGAQPMRQAAQDPLASQPLAEIASARAVGILKGPNGRGSGFFLTQDGMIATTRSVVGMNVMVDITLENGQTLLGQVVRSFPALDLAFIRVKARVHQLLAPSSSPVLMAETPLIAVVYPATGVRTVCRATRDQAPPHFFPTTITKIDDAGGCPVLEAQTGLLVGMLTKNKRSEADMCYGLHISEIYRALDLFRQEETQTQQGGHYCHNCGAHSRLGSLGGYYCELCGGTLAAAVAQTRTPQPQLVQAYGENTHSPCANCGGRAGYYNNQCLRCGYDLARRKAQQIG